MVDPGNMVERIVNYDRMLMLYWVNMNLLTHSSLTTVAKLEGDEEPIRAWKEHNADCHLMHRKIDLMASHMGIQFFHPGSTQAKLGGLSRKVKKKEIVLHDNADMELARKA